MTKSTCFGQHHQVFHPKDLYAVRVLYKVCSRVSMSGSHHQGFWVKHGL